ncbi:ABC transporter ATP-binding protein [Enterococcus sp. CSURQ0835]|uniref:ABC transporter ATP-binding protein n=1 Tax=Enterococcus sp. CSURQ0835 TaxID=2681394 RepID=UPI00135B9D29|nr:ABC transporter ATP-binding protein [Enterococcus sp. CSURQ0835]
MLTLQKITKTFDTTPILKDISLTIADGEIVSILGASGSGKTTLLNVILGLETATSGQLFYREQEITNWPMEKRPFNIVFQDYALFPNLNAYDNLTYGLHKNPGLTSPEELAELIELLGLEQHLQKRVQQLSGGQKQRVALGRTLVMRPNVLLLDEPLSALDGVIKESIKNRIKLIAKKLKLTTIIVTHDPEEALTMSDKILVLADGCVAQYGTPQEIITNASDLFVQQFIVQQLEIKRQNIEKIFAQTQRKVVKVG